MNSVVFYFKNEKYKYIIQFFRKSGCSTLRNLFVKLYGNDDNSHDNNKPYLFTDSNFLNMKQYENYYKISVVRNSYERIISMYFNRYLNVYFPNENFSIKKHKTFNEFIKSFKEQPSFIKNDAHFKDQSASINKNIDKYIYLNNLNKELLYIYKNIIKLNDDKLSLIEKILNDKQEVLKKKKYNLSRYTSSNKNFNFGNNKLCDYNFQKDEFNLNILNNGVPIYKQMITEENAILITALFKREIEYHNFGYSHLI